MLGDRPLGRGHIYRLLSNPLYVGRIAHRGESYEGQHAAIIDPETWDAVQKLLGAQAPARGSRAGSARPSPLRGKLFDESGVVLTPSHAVKSGRRYRYYLSRSSHSNSTTSNPEHDRSPRWRLPAREIERRRWNRTAERLCGTEPDIVGQYHDDVGGTLRNRAEFDVWWWLGLRGERQ